MSETTAGKLGITLPTINQAYGRLPELAALADEAGFDSVWDYEVYRNPFTVHALCAQTTQNVLLATGLATSAGRSPFEMANAAADVDELSGGRAVIGMSTGVAGFADHLHGADVSRPLPKLREYIQCMRVAWDYQSTGQAQQFEGEFYSFQSPPFNPWGGRDLERPRIPIYLGALKPGMLRFAGGAADGVLAYLMSARYIKEQWLHHVVEGAEIAGRNPSEVDSAALVLCSVGEDREAAMRLARINVGLYAAYPTSEPMVDYEGLTEDRAAVVNALMSEGPAALAHTTSDALVKAFAIAGTPDEAREQLTVFQGAVSHVVLHMPYMPPINREESERAYLNAVKFLGRSS
ncbi:MAG: LLM class flavin-dependent oxidoreductase [Halieaceae bacterium]|nr:LLM class flavin-dependent oxidoreductase [Halieaceae bacterium]